MGHGPPWDRGRRDHQWRILPRKTEGDRWSFTSFSLQPAITAAAAAADKLRNTSLIHRAHTILRPTASNAARHTPLSVKWTSDVVAVAVRQAAREGGRDAAAPPAHSPACQCPLFFVVAAPRTRIATAPSCAFACSTTS